MNKVEHIGIAVKDLQAAGSLYEKLLNTKIYKTEKIASESVKTAFLQTGPNKIELLEALVADSAIAKFIEQKGEGIHHIAFEVDDIVAEMTRLKSEGFVLLSDEPRLGADNKLVCFVHPKSAGGVLVELVQERSKGNVLERYHVRFFEKIFFDKPRRSMESDSVILDELMLDHNSASDVKDYLIKNIDNIIYGTQPMGHYISDSLVVLEISKDITNFYYDPEYSSDDIPEFIIPTLHLMEIAEAWASYLES